MGGGGVREEMIFLNIIAQKENTKENQKADISCISVESCILDVTWGVILCRRRYLLFG